MIDPAYDPFISTPVPPVAPPGARTVAPTVPLRGETSSDRKILALRALWLGLEQTPPPDPAIYEARLTAFAPNAREVSRWAANRAGLARFCDQAAFTFAPVLLHGPNGVGKTSLACQLAAAAGLSAQVLSVAGKNDPRTFLGTSPGYTTGLPALPAQIMARTGRCNPVIILDEIDKHALDPARGSWLDGLLPFLEPATSERLYDEYLGVEVDYSAINWIFTANSIDALPKGFLDRLTCFEVPVYIGAAAPEGAGQKGLAMLAEALNMPAPAVLQLCGGVPPAMEIPEGLSPRRARAALLDCFAEHLRARVP